MITRYPVRALRILAELEAAEPATFDDKALALDDAATVGLAHPWHFASDRPAWAEVFSDYEIIQPFAQLSREVFSVAATDPGSFAGSGTEDPTGRR